MDAASLRDLGIVGLSQVIQNNALGAVNLVTVCDFGNSEMNSLFWCTSCSEHCTRTAYRRRDRRQNKCRKATVEIPVTTYIVPWTTSTVCMSDTCIPNLIPGDPRHIHHPVYERTLRNNTQQRNCAHKVASTWPDLSYQSTNCLLTGAAWSWYCKYLRILIQVGQHVAQEADCSTNELIWRCSMQCACGVFHVKQGIVHAYVFCMPYRG
jgi:hypothetical protein